MTEVWMYTVASSSGSDGVSCVVPWRLDEDLIFFGPCKTRIRERLRKKYLSQECNHRLVSDEIVIVGVNGSNVQRTRKIVWAGRLAEVMTFAEAHRRLKGNKFRSLRRCRCSPLHVRPVTENGELRGYEHVSKEHIENNGWVSDLTSAWRGFQVTGRTLMLQQRKRSWDVFDRDWCLLLENLFFADGQGIEFDNNALDILRKAQPQKSKEIDDYAVFGRTKNGQANGLKGNYLRIEGQLAKRFITWLQQRSRTQRSVKHASAVHSTQSICGSRRSRHEHLSRRC